MKKIIILLQIFTLYSCSISHQISANNHINLPKPIGPYSHSTSFRDLIFISGQIGVDPITNELKQGTQAQTLQILENITQILKDNNSDFEHVLKTTIFITDIKEFELVNEIYAKQFKRLFPSRSTLEVKALARGASIEIECIAVVKN